MGWANEEYLKLLRRADCYRVRMQVPTAPSLCIEIEAAVVYNFLYVIEADYNIYTKRKRLKSEGRRSLEI